MKDYKQNEIVYHKEEALDIANEMAEKVGELYELWQELERLGYSDYKIEQELAQGYMGDTLRNQIEELPEILEKVADEDEVEDADSENERITEKFFEMLDEKKTFEEIKKATGVLEVELDENQEVLTIHYPNGEIISHWV